MNTGKVCWFTGSFGYIEPDGGGPDVFVHYKGIAGEGFRKLQRGQRVRFNVEANEKGPCAVDVEVMQ